ncbi:MAG: hypothetical protein KZQ99_22885 [Candidatus Thiodiazotropha sp. (ex Dulcina madagascariensis)]|nr:hypothetical protein [Candidatus Thiodiazotropha sp. (ex Dulcina madagascariensis)]
MKKLILPILLSIGMFPFASHAACTQSGHVKRITAWNDGVGASHFIYLRTDQLLLVRANR